MDHGGRGRVLAEQEASIRARTMLSVDRLEVEVPTPDDGHIVVRVRERRSDVIARLLSMGVSARTLSMLLPEWTDLIESVASEHAFAAPMLREPGY